MTLTPARPAPGAPANVTIAVRNDGERVAEGVRLTDEVSGGTTLRSASSPAGACAVTDRRAACPLGGLAPGDAVTAEVRLLVDHEPASRTLRQRIDLSAAGQPEVASRGVSTLVEGGPVRVPSLLELPGTTVQLIAFVGFVLAAKSRSGPGR